MRTFSIDNKSNLRKKLTAIAENSTVWEDLTLELVRKVGACDVRLDRVDIELDNIPWSTVEAEITEAVNTNYNYLKNY